MQGFDKKEIVRDLIRRKRARESLHSFTLNVEIPTDPHNALYPDEDLLGPARFLMPIHHAKILEVAERTILRPYGRALIMAPPGTAKSTKISVTVPPWVMGKFPGSRIILTSYASSLAHRQARRAKQIALSKAYRDLWEVTPEIIKDSDPEWTLQIGEDISEMLSAGITAGITGNRANGCFVGDTPVSTPTGPKRIDSIIRDDVVYGYDHQRGGIVAASVRAVRQLHSANLVRVRTKAGRSFICTADHPIYVPSRGYTAAALLKKGQALTGCDVPDVRQTQTCRIEGVSSMFRRFAAVVRNGALRAVREARNAGTLGMGKAREERHQARVLRAPLRDSRDQRFTAKAEVSKSAGREKTPIGESLHQLYTRISASIFTNAVLLQSLCRRYARRANAWVRQLALEIGKKLCAVVSLDEAFYSSEGSGLRELSRKPNAGGASHRREAREQQGRKLSRAMQSMSPKAAPISDQVELVERLRTRAQPVYDIEVEGVHNFFAGQILAHNCIIDDPVAGREEADSPAVRKKTLDAYQDDLLTRLLPGAWLILIQTRWHELDLAGEILPHDYKGQSGMIRCRDGLDWEVLNMPAKAEHHDDPLGRKIGEYIWPEYYDPKHWQMFENGVGPERQRTWTSLYQQRPSPQGSGKFTREMVRYYDELPESAQRAPRILCSDWAVTAGKNDFSEIGVAALDSDDNLYLIDWWCKQADTGEVMAQYLAMVIRHNSQLGFNEGGVIDKAVRPTFTTSLRDYNAKARREGRRSVYHDLRSLPSMQDKLAKTGTFGARMSMGQVLWPRRAPWTERVLEQLFALPAGRFDDAADVCGLFGRGLEQYHPPAAAKIERKVGIKPFTAAWIEFSEDKKPAVRYR